MPLARHPPPMTLSEFLAWEERQELRYEFDGFAPVAKNGDSRGHETVRMNLLVALANRLRGSSCRAHGCNLKIEVAGRIRYPDAFVTCGEPGAPRDTVERSPVVVFEVLSESTQTVDPHGQGARVPGDALRPAATLTWRWWRWPRSSLGPTTAAGCSGGPRAVAAR